MEPLILISSPDGKVIILSYQKKKFNPVNIPLVFINLFEVKSFPIVLFLEMQGLTGFSSLRMLVDE